MYKRLNGYDLVKYPYRQPLWQLFRVTHIAWYFIGIQSRAPGAAGYLDVLLAERDAPTRTAITSPDDRVDAGAATQACATLD